MYNKYTSLLKMYLRAFIYILINRDNNCITLLKMHLRTNKVYKVTKS
jgi:hypothetical protein